MNGCWIGGQLHGCHFTVLYFHICLTCAVIIKSSNVANLMDVKQDSMFLNFIFPDFNELQHYFILVTQISLCTNWFMHPPMPVFLLVCLLLTNFRSLYIYIFWILVLCRGLVCKLQISFPSLSLSLAFSNQFVVTFAIYKFLIFMQM